MNIVFISEMKDMKVDASSTQIMTYNLVHGLFEAGYSVTFLAICEENCNTDSVIEDFQPITDRVFCLPSAMNLISKKRRKLTVLLTQYIHAINVDWYSEKLKEVHISKPVDCVLTHLPAIESAYYAKALKKELSASKYIQYWSDPYARSGLTASEKMPAKRTLLKKLESYLLKQADEIVYGTSLLMETQAKQYPYLAEKMRSCDVSYNVYHGESLREILFENNRLIVGYVGSYRSVHRNADPLYAVFRSNPELGNLILCGNTDIEREDAENIKVIQKCSPSRALGIEEQLDIHVCLLNKTMSQIPGKIFYQTNSGKPILVILDGPDKAQIQSYLMKFDRFEFAENTEADILEALRRIITGRSNVKTSAPPALSPLTFAKSVIGTSVY